jgi:hypothetical protein
VIGGKPTSFWPVVLKAIANASLDSSGSTNQLAAPSPWPGGVDAFHA